MAESWIVAGAKVLCYSTGGITTPANPHLTTIKKVATKSFTVDDDREPRFSLDTMSARQDRGSFSSWTRRVVPVDSDTARKVLAQQRRDMAMSEARRAVDEWQKNRSRDNRLAAIAALQAVEED